MPLAVTTPFASATIDSLITEAAYSAAVGATAKLKVYAALETALGITGTVS